MDTIIRDRAGEGVMEEGAGGRRGSGGKLGEWRVVICEVGSGAGMGRMRGQEDLLPPSWIRTYLPTYAWA